MAVQVLLPRGTRPAWSNLLCVQESNVVWQILMDFHPSMLHLGNLGSDKLNCPSSFQSKTLVIDNSAKPAGAWIPSASPFRCISLMILRYRALSPAGLTTKTLLVEGTITQKEQLDEQHILVAAS